MPLRTATMLTVLLMPLGIRAQGDTATLGLWPIHKDGQMGFMNRQGKVIIEPTFDSVSPFHDGLAVAEVGRRFSNGAQVTGR